MQGIKKSSRTCAVRDDVAGDEGFEPPQTESESGVLPLHKSPMDALRQNASIIIQICAHLSSVNFKKCGKNKHSHFCLPEQKKPARARTARNARRRENEEREKRLFLLSPAPVSYTHLDVYKRQIFGTRNSAITCSRPRRSMRSSTLPRTRRSRCV